MSNDLLKKIFIVDEDQQYATVLGNHINERKLFRIFHFSTVDACLHEMHQSPDVVILDSNLNSYHASTNDGLEMVEKIKKHHHTTKVIVLSGQEHYGVAAQTIAKGASMYVMKDGDALQDISNFLEELN